MIGILGDQVFNKIMGVKRSDQMNDMNAIVVTDVLVDLVKQLKEIRLEIKTLKENETYLKDIIAYHMQGNEAMIDENGVVLVTYKTSIQNRFDGESFKDGYPDLYKMYTKQSEVRTLLIKE